MLKQALLLGRALLCLLCLLLLEQTLLLSRALLCLLLLEQALLLGRALLCLLLLEQTLLLGRTLLCLLLLEQALLLRRLLLCLLLLEQALLLGRALLCLLLLEQALLLGRKLLCLLLLHLGIRPRLRFGVGSGLYFGVLPCLRDRGGSRSITGSQLGDQRRGASTLSLRREVHSVFECAKIDRRNPAPHALPFHLHLSVYGPFLPQVVHLLRQILESSSVCRRVRCCTGGGVTRRTDHGPRARKRSRRCVLHGSGRLSAWCRAVAVRSGGALLDEAAALYARALAIVGGQNVAACGSQNVAACGSQNVRVENEVAPTLRDELRHFSVDLVKRFSVMNLCGQPLKLGLRNGAAIVTDDIAAAGGNDGNNVPAALGDEIAAALGDQIAVWINDVTVGADCQPAWVEPN